jgi:hypothetical protein
MPKIKFISNRPWLTKNSPSAPEPISKSLPDWYKDADRYAKMPNGEYWVGPDKGKIPTWKACPAIYDIFITGYTYKTPCDIDFFIDNAGQISAKVLDPKYKDFIQLRDPMPQFEHPRGYYKKHFAWYPDWAVATPSGYSVLYSQPFGRYDLPFMTTSGIVDNDNVNLPGTFPFFIQDGWTGTIPAGTPYAQMIPFRREDWESDYEFEAPTQIMKKNMENSKKYRVPNGGVYLKDVWQRRKYE